MARENIERYNILKGISIYFVVCIHIVYTFFEPDSKPFLFEVYNYMTGFAVPFFLIMGGFFFAKKYLDEGEKRITKEQISGSIATILQRIVIPYYIFVVILTLYNYLFGKSIFWRHFLFVDSNEHGLYFLIIYAYAFLFSLVLIYVLQALPKYFVAFFLAFFSLVFFLITNQFDQFHGVVFLQLPLISFFCFGVLLYFPIVYFENKLSWKVMSASLITALVIFTVIIVVGRNIFGPFPVITSAPPTVFRLVYCLLVFWLSLALLSQKALSGVLKKVGLESFGVKSMFIFLVHPYFLKAMVPGAVYGLTTLGLDYHTNLFLGPVLLGAYVITLLSSKFLDLLPTSIGALFSR